MYRENWRFDLGHYFILCPCSYYTEYPPKDDNDAKELEEAIEILIKATDINQYSDGPGGRIYTLKYDSDREWLRSFFVKRMMEYLK